MSDRSDFSETTDRGHAGPRVHLRGPVAPASTERPESRYTIGEQIGEGGESIVLRTHDIDLGREVALKVLREESNRSPESLERFLEEARSAGRLQHPGILPVYELGLLPDGRPFVTMKLPRGQTFEEILAEPDDSPSARRRRLGIFEQVCQAVAYAHSRDVVHGRLDPDRVIVGPFGDVTVTDWGGDGDHDVRSIGNMLCRILTGSTDSEALDACEADAELVSLCRRCLADGGPDAGAVAGEMAGYLAATEDRAHRLEVRSIERRAAAERAAERADAARAEAAELRRARRQLLLLATAILVTLLTAGGAWWWIEADRQERAARASAVVRENLRQSARLAGEGRSSDALAAAERADELAAAPAVPDHLRDRAAERLQSLRTLLVTESAARARAERERNLPGLLLEIRARRGIDPAKVTAGAYAQAFRDYGIALDATAAARIQADPLAAELVRALDDWAGIEEERPRADLLRRIAGAVPGPSALPGTLEDLEAEWLRRPDDLSVNLRMAELHLGATPPRAAAAVRYLTAATALAPESAGLWLRLGDACRQAGDGFRAARACRYALELDPTWEEARRRAR